ncbi:MAG: thioredoxin-dependent thiol peroxidase [Bacteroidetes bacterium]|nr:thioredoxin-dependent thiol peroxidase [Bacteroidota bacterium]
MSKITIGNKAPDFTAKDENGKDISLSDFVGKKVVLFFYPKDNTPGCTAESCNLGENYELLRKKGFEVIGVSADSQKRHRNFIEKYDLPYRLVADEDKKVINAYGVWGPKKFMGLEYEGIKRTTFIINENGIIDRIFDKVETKNHTQQILSTY